MASLMLPVMGMAASAEECEALILRSRALQSESKLLRDHARRVKDHSRRVVRAQRALLADLAEQGFQVRDLPDFW